MPIATFKSYIYLHRFEDLVVKYNKELKAELKICFTIFMILLWCYEASKINGQKSRETRDKRLIIISEFACRVPNRDAGVWVVVFFLRPGGPGYTSGDGGDGENRIKKNCL